MKKHEAIKLHNRDEVTVRTSNGWQPGYVLGEPKKVGTADSFRVMVPVVSTDGYQTVDHTDVK